MSSVQLPLWRRIFFFWLCTWSVAVFPGLFPARVAAESVKESEGPPDKSCYNLFNPVPKDRMREFSPDRPDKTESPITVDAGHFVIESSIASYTYNHFRSSDPERTKHGLAIMESNVKAGLLNNVDLQVDFQPFIRQQSGSGEKLSGNGDTEVRLKINLWGNDGGTTTAMAIMPFVSIPTSPTGLGADSVEGGVIFPFQIKAPYDWTIALMTQVNAIKDASGNGYHPECINSVAFHHDVIPEKLDGYLEFFSNNSFDAGKQWSPSVDMGLIYKLGENLLLDCGVNIGLTGDSDDVNPFVGFSWRY